MKNSVCLLALLGVFNNLFLQPALAEKHQIIVKGATWKFVADPSYGAVSTTTIGWASNTLGLVSPPTPLTTGSYLAYGFYKKTQIAITVSHSKTGEVYQLFQGLKGRVDSNIPTANEPNKTNWYCDEYKGDTKSSTSVDGLAPSDWILYSASQSTIGQYNWQSPQTLYMWDNPGFSCLQSPSPGDIVETAMVGSPGTPPANPGSWFCNVYRTFEDVIKYQINGRYVYVAGRSYGNWSRTVLVKSTPNANYPAPHLRWVLAGANN